MRLRFLLTATLLASAVLVIPSAVQAQIRSLVPNTGQPIPQMFGFLQNANLVGQARFLSSPNRFYGNNGGGGGFNGGYLGGYGYGGYGGYYGDFSLGNTLQGVSSVISAQGQFQIQNQQAKVVQQQAAQSKLDTRRKQFDELRYEQENTPTLEDLRVKMMQEELRRIRNDAPPSEVWSGAALNTLLKTIQKEEAYLGTKGPPLPVDPTLVKQLQLTGGAVMSGVGVLNDGKPDWPLGLQKQMFAADKKKIDDLSNQIVKQAAAGPIDAATLNNLKDSTVSLKAKIKSQIGTMDYGDYVKANRFANELLDATRSLEDPAAVNLFNGNWVAKASTVPELIDQMTKSGLTFAPSAGGDEAAYSAMYRALASYDTSLSQMTSRLQSAGPPGVRP